MSTGSAPDDEGSVTPASLVDGVDAGSGPSIHPTTDSPLPIRPALEPRSTVALVESPAQLLNVLEWAHSTQATGADVAIIVLAPRQEMTRLQLRRMADIARETGFGVHWHEPRLGGASTARTVRSLAGTLSEATRLVIGDPFSGVMQVILSVSRPREVVVVDDGSATLEFARQWAAGEDLVRWHTRRTAAHTRQIVSFARGQLAYSARRRMTAEAGCRLSIFTCMPVELDKVAVSTNDFAWVRSRYAPPVVKAGGDMIGTSLVETGVVDEEHYVAAVRRLAATHHLDRYLAHRKEGATKLARIEALGLRVLRPELPLEMLARLGPVGATVVSFPSTVVHTLPLVLADTSVKLLVCDVDDAWFTPHTAATSERFLSAVTSTARDRHGLAAVAS